jgi:transposase
MAFVMVLSYSRQIFLRFFLDARMESFNEKGRVERAIRYVRDNFFAARKFTDLDDLNVQATHEQRTGAPDDGPHSKRSTRRNAW